MPKTRKLVFKEFPRKKLKVYWRNKYDYRSYDAGNEDNFKQFYIKKGDTIVDIGGYTGGELMWFIARNKPVKYYCIEPIPENVKIIKKNIGTNKSCLDITILNVAIGSENGEMKMFYGDTKTDWGKQYYYRGNICDKEYRGKKYTMVKKITLDKLFEKIEKCKLMRMEPEQTDLEILNSASIDTLNKIKWIIGALPTHKGLVESTGGLFEKKNKNKNGIYILKNRCLN